MFAVTTAPMAPTSPRITAPRRSADAFPPTLASKSIQMISKHRRPIVAILLGVLLTPLLASAQQATSKKTIRLLTVGNSFSQNATKYLDKIVEADGNVLVHHRCVIGGSGPDQH